MTTTAEETSPGSIWATLREAVRGTNADFTKIPIGRAVLLLAVPMVLEMLMESVFAVADVFWVGHLHLTDAISTVGFTESVMTVVYAVAVGLSVGAAATVARRIGEGDADGASCSAVQSIILGVGVGAIVGVTGILFAPQLLRMMGAEEGVVSTGTTFARVMIGASGGVTLLFMINSVFRGAGDAAIAMRVLWIANAINITLSPLLIFGVGPFPRLGVTGAAVGTSIGRWTGVLIQLYVLTRKDGRITIRWPNVRFDGRVMRAILRLSGTATFQNFVGTASYMGLVKIISTFGTAAIAGNTIGIRIFLFALLPSWGVSNAAVTLVGQNLGAGHPERAEESAWKICIYNTVCLVSIGVVFMLFAPLIVSAFTTDVEVSAIAVRCLRIVSTGFLFYGYGMALTAAFNGAGDTRTPTLINVFSLWIVELPLAWVLAHPLGFGPTGAFIALSVGFSTMCFISVWLFRRGHWKTQRV
ncbi:MAG TPA: MATE family efflux transporter [Vicinamibacterales bacterium]|nr:MATE family efflux transporter [Vicinamibacterales bacterium]